MNPNLKNFCVTPSVVRTDQESELSIVCVEGELRFFDDVTYEITCIPQEESDVPLDDEMSLLGYNKARIVQYVKPVNGVLKVRYYFTGEQEWRIHIATKEYEKHQNPLYEHYRDHWGWLINKPCEGIDLFVYSLQEDLYERRPRRGDLHAHTNISDGKETPATVAACYRKAGRDFVAITDHNMFFSPTEAKNTFGFMENFTVIPGEEVHNGYVGYFHMVNIGGNYSVNRRYLEEKDAVEREVEALFSEITVPENVDAREYAARVWLYREIKKSGGLAIFPHPFWKIGYNHTSTAMSKVIIKNRLCDAFEVLGGVSPRENNLQVAFYNDLRAEGCTVPAVGSTDSHSARTDKHTGHSTVVFTAKDRDVLQAIVEGYSVPVESLSGENVRVYGNLRLSSYVHFLLENYFPLHDELCAISGVWMEEYSKGDESAKELLEKTERQITVLEERFFGT